MVAAGAGAIVGPLILQRQSAAAELLAATFLDEKGRPRRLLDWRGQALLCNFWGTWCPPCLEEMPLLDSFLDKIRAKRGEIVGIAIDNASNVWQFSRKHKIRYPILLAGLHVFALLRRLGNSAEALPFTVILDRAGAVGYRKLGAVKPADLEAALGPLLG